jgi:Cyclic nucleotide-binding domain
MDPSQALIRSTMGCTLSKDESLDDDDGDIEKGALHHVGVATSLLVGTAAAATLRAADTVMPYKLQSTTQPTDSVGVMEQVLAVEVEDLLPVQQSEVENNTKPLGMKGHQTWKEKTHHLRNIFAKPLEFGDEPYVPPVYPKTDEDTSFIEKALKDGLVFESISRRATIALIRAFEKEQVATGTTIITEGDEGDYFYIILSGTVEFSINGESVGCAAAGASFGELALLYSAPRAATVVATEDTVLFRVDQKAFRYILQAQTKEGEKGKNNLLQRVDFLKGLSENDMAKLAANMTPMQYV